MPAKGRLQVKDKLMNIVERLREFIENEMRSCSMDIGGITPLYVYRMWGGRFSLANGLTGLKNQGITE